MLQFKQVQEKEQVQDLHFSIYSHIKENGRLPRFISKSRLNYFVSRLKKAEFIRKKGYGVWETLKDFDISKLKQVQTSARKIPKGTPQHHPIRGHAFQFKVQIPKLPNWHKRRVFFDKNNIKFKEVSLGKGESIFFKGKKIWFFDKLILIYDKSSYLSDSAIGSKNFAIFEMIETIKSLENLFKVSFRINKKYKFKVSKHHYARLSCELAKQYRKDGKKLSIKQEDGTTWLWIDHSLNIDETETGNTKRSGVDMDKHIHPFLNSLRTVKGYTPQWVTDMFANLIEDRKFHAENNRSHVKAVQDLGSGVKKLTKTVDTLAKKVFKPKVSYKESERNKKLNRWL